MLPANCWLNMRNWDHIYFTVRAFLRAGDLWLAEEAVHFSLTKVFFFFFLVRLCFNACETEYTWIYFILCVFMRWARRHMLKMSSCNYSRAPSASGKFSENLRFSLRKLWGKKKYIYFINVPLKIDSCSLRSLITFIHSACREGEREGENFISLVKRHQRFDAITSK